MLYVSLTMLEMTPYDPPKLNLFFMLLIVDVSQIDSTLINLSLFFLLLFTYSYCFKFIIRFN